jgi:hypothetical protein
LRQPCGIFLCRFRRRIDESDNIGTAELWPINQFSKNKRCVNNPLDVAFIDERSEGSKGKMTTGGKELQAVADDNLM